MGQGFLLLLNNPIMLLLLFPVLSGGCPAVPRTLLQEKHSTPCGKMCVSRPKCMVFGREIHPCAVSRRERREGQGFILLGIALHELLRLGAGNGLAAVFELRIVQGQGIEALGMVPHAAAVKNAFDG